MDKIEVSFHFNIETGKSETILNGKNVESEIRKHEVSSFVSIVSQVKQIRDKLVVLQREKGKKKRSGDGWKRYWNQSFSFCRIEVFYYCKSRNKSTEAI